MTPCHEPFADATLTGRAHPDTSFIAARRALGGTGTARRRVLEALAVEDLTDEEMQARLRMSPNTQRPRRVELCVYGLAVATSRRRKTSTGNYSIVWTATDAGREALHRARAEDARAA